MPKQIKKLLKIKSGFSLIEIMIVVSIIGVIAVVGVTSYSGLTQKARDTKRKVEIANIQRVLEIQKRTSKYILSPAIAASAFKSGIPQDPGVFSYCVAVSSSNVATLAPLNWQEFSCPDGFMSLEDSINNTTVGDPPTLGDGGGSSWTICTTLEGESSTSNAHCLSSVTAKLLAAATPFPLGYTQSTPIPTSTPTQAPTPTPPSGPFVGTARGYTTTPGELATIKTKYDAGTTPYVANVNALFNHTNYRLISDPNYWPWGTIIGEIIEFDDTSVTPTAPKCGDDESGPNYVEKGGPLTYAKALGYHLTGNATLAESARVHILDLTDTYGYGSVPNPATHFGGSNNCILGLAWGIPEFIFSADLLETYPGWTVANKASFQSWLATVVYPKVSWASRVRNNNWGAGGSYAAAIIADYLHDSGLTLNEVSPTAKSLSPSQAYAEQNQMQFDRMNTSWVGDSLCTNHGIQSYGGIPDETRRGTTGCDGTYLLDDDKSWDYMATHLEATIPHAEFLLRRGSNSMYNHIAGNGTGSILQGILYVIANPTLSWDWVKSKKSTLHMAYRYYRNAAINSRLNTSEDPYIEAGNITPFAKVTHGFNTSTENPGNPPTTSPP